VECRVLLSSTASSFPPHKKETRERETIIPFHFGLFGNWDFGIQRKDKGKME